jgi:uncharacterized membrane protein
MKKNTMSSLSEAKTLGGIGSILVLFTAVPNIGLVLGIAGLVMILVAIGMISQVFNERKIFSNMLTAFVLGVVALGVGVLTIIGSLYHLLGMGSFAGTRFVLTHAINTSDWVGLAAVVIAGLLAVWAISIGSAVFVCRSFKSVASKVDVKTFETAGLFFLIGAATAILGVGLLLIFVAEIMLAVAFFSIQEHQLPRTASSTTPPVSG